MRSCLLLAQSGHPDTWNQCPLLGVKRTSTSANPMSAFNPLQTSIGLRERYSGSSSDFNRPLYYPPTEVRIAPLLPSCPWWSGRFAFGGRPPILSAFGVSPAELAAGRAYRGAAANSKAARVSGGFAFLPTNADFREGIVGAVELAMGGELQPCVPHASGPKAPVRLQDHRLRAIGHKRLFRGCGTDW
jgi:hypothetical protein